MFIKNFVPLLIVSSLLTACGGSGSSPAPSAVTSAPAPENSLPVKPTVFLFSASNGNNGYELWKTEGTAETTVMVKDINASGDSDIEDIIRVGDLSYFTADDGVNNNQLWVSDGTDTGTIALATNPGDRIALNGKLYFSAGEVGNVNGSELWVTDGTAAGTKKVKDIDGTTSSSSVGKFAILGETLYFSANDRVKGNELWKSDGTAAGTVMVQDIYTGSDSSNPSSFVALNNKLIFAAQDSANGNELWTFDGTTASLLKDINPGATRNSGAMEHTAVIGNTLYFNAYTDTNGEELWKTDGTTAGTVLVSDIRSGTSSSSPERFAVVGSKLFFVADDGTHGKELWSTDGTTTAMVKDINVGSGKLLIAAAKVGPAAVSNPNSNPAGLVGIADKLYFQANDGADTELWVSDGTEAGTAVLKDINTTGRSEPFPLGQLQYANADVLAEPNVGVLFAATTVDKGQELWISNGTAVGTVMVKDINPDAGNGIKVFAK